MSVVSLRLIAFVVAWPAALAAPSLDREIVLTPHVGARTEDQEIIRWQGRAGKMDARDAEFQRLAWAYVAKARLTLDPGFYKLAEKTIDVADATFGPSPDSRLLRGHILHTLHRFQAAEKIAQRLAAERGQPEDFALLSDALIEQGKLNAGIAALERLVALKPGVEAFSRIAHVRWLKGDLPGAIAALESAWHASGSCTTETQAWLLMRLAGLHLQRGDVEAGMQHADASLARVSEYPPALLAHGRALIASGKAGDAIAPLQLAAKLQPLPEYQWWLADALVLAGRPREAEVVEQALIDRGGETDARTLALFLATRGIRILDATRLARRELAERQDVFSHAAHAWVLFVAGDIEAADQEMSLGLSAGTKDARLLLHAAEIARARGDSQTAAGFFAEAETAQWTLTPSERELLTRRLAAGGRTITAR